ncbi:Ig-like domain-containing protein [Pseudorhodobacter sp. E13]|uniref:Ig-like domain-containing protein n=1 Tax=Pseudorhodobacter sp. E13 TaxID=2487931 RepID=UPI0013155F2F|nr:Ig-like domain-containing protein [Pseudorhodobacter sp. E13]
MVKAIDFAVRTSAGKVVRGAVAGEGGSEFLQVGSGETVSLNLSQSSVLGYERQGKDLVLKLSDGRQITLSGYFESAAGEDNRLYLSSNGEVTEVFLTDGGDGTMYANYGPVDTWNKYSNVDDIRFTDDNTLMAADGYSDDTVGMGPFAPALLAGLGGSGLGTAAAVAGGLGVLGSLGGGGGGGGGGGSTGPSRVPPAVNEANSSKDITTNTEDKTVAVTGTGEPGETVKVVVGDKTQSTTILPDGTWETEFDGDDFPGDGTFEAVVTVTDKDGGKTVLDGPGFVIDLTPPEVTPTEGFVSTNDVENLLEYANGVTVKGEGEVGAKIVVTVEGGSQSTTVGTDGTWSVTFTQAQIAGGEYHEIPVTIVATDPMGNKTTITDKIAVDTVPHPLTFNSVTDDNAINAIESNGEVLVTGVSTPGAMVTVKMGTTTQTVETNASGTWTARYPSGTFAGNDGDRTFTATTVDAAGNPSSATHTMKVDTTTTVNFAAGNLTADNIINADEANAGVTLTGTAEAGSKSVSVQWNGVTLPVDTLAADGNWSVKFPTSAVQATGTTTATVTAIDAYGNSDTDVRDITVDRSTTVSVNPNQAGGDNIIMSTEADAGVKLTGLAERGAKVEVTFQGTTHTVYASETDGSWNATFSSAEIARGTYDTGANTVVSVKATDKAGNTATANPHILTVDTEVNPFTAGTNSYNSIKSDKVLNNDEAANGLTVTGTVEAGSSVKLSFGNAGPFEATVTGTTWTYTIPAASIPGGDQMVKLTVTATDKLGNISTPYTEMIDIDRVVTPFTRSGGMIGDDGVLNAVEVANGLNLNGTGEVGSTVVVSLPTGATQTIEVGSSGTWTASFTADQLPRGDGTSMKIDFKATDLAGNTASFSETVTIDTVAPDSPDITTFSKNTAGTDLVGVKLDEAINSDFTFHRVGANGSHTEIQLDGPTTGSKWADFESSPIPEGDYLVVSHADDAGNDSSTLFLTNNTGTSTIDLGNAGLRDFDFTTLDLTVAKTSMTISAEDLIAITGPENTLVIKGGADDSITLQDAQKAADQGSAPAGFTLYTLGDDGASIYLDDDIQPTF